MHVQVEAVLRCITCSATITYSFYYTLANQWSKADCVIIPAPRKLLDEPFDKLPLSGFQIASINTSPYEYETFPIFTSTYI